MNGTITIIIPTRNRAHLLRQALTSLALQTRPCTEAIVIDAGADGSDAIAKEYAFVRYVRQTSTGLTRARNEALALARGDYVGMLDSDDLSPDFLFECSKLLDRDPRLMVAYTRGTNIDKDGRQIGTILCGHRCPNDPVRALVHDNFVINSFCLMRRSALLSVGGYDESLQWADDYDLFLRIALQGGRFAHAPRYLAARRRHDGSLTSAFPMDNLAAMRGILERHSAAIGSALHDEKPGWLSGLDYRAGRIYLEQGDVASARELFRTAAKNGHVWARLYCCWCRWYRPLNRLFVTARRVKRTATRGLSQLGLFESRWS